MKFAKWLFIVAGIYGLAILTPLYFREAQIAQDYPPAVTHPEYYYGFIGVALAWQILFFLVALDPVRYRLMMLPGAAEKAGYGVAVMVLFSMQRVPQLLVYFGAIDLAFCVLFLTAFWLTAQTGNGVRS